MFEIENLQETLERFINNQNIYTHLQNETKFPIIYF